MESEIYIILNNLGCFYWGWIIRVFQKLGGTCVRDGWSRCWSFIITRGNFSSDQSVGQFVPSAANAKPVVG